MQKSENFEKLTGRVDGHKLNISLQIIDGSTEHVN